MEKAEYSELKNHRQIHNDFLAKLKTLKAPLDDAVIAWTKKWWASYFATTGNANDYLIYKELT